MLSAVTLPDLGALTALIVSLTALVAAVGVALASWRQAKATHAVVTQIDAAVNGKEPGEQAMVSEVHDIHNAVTGDKREGDRGHV